MRTEDQYDEYIKAERGTGGWRDLFLTDPPLVRMADGRRYVPKSGFRGVRLLNADVHAFDDAIAGWTANLVDPTLLETPPGGSGYDSIIRQAGYEYTWEWALIDPARPWSVCVPPVLRGFIFNDLVERAARLRGPVPVRAVAKKLAS